MSTLLEVADALYALPLGDFTAARDARAKDLKADDADLSREVKALRKPATAAWVVNQLVRGDAEQVAQVLAVGDALREAQRSMSAEDLRALTRQRRQLTAAVTQRARSIARAQGLRVTEAVAAQVEATMTAAILDEQCAAAVRSGLLVAPLAATGVEGADVALSLAVPDAVGVTATPGSARSEPERPDLRVVPDPDAAAKARAAAEALLAEAEEEHDRADQAHDEAQSDVAELEARALQLGSEVEEVRRRLAELEESAEATDDELEDAEEVRDEAARALASATAERDAARSALTALERS